jgi:hypothetical protein
MVLIRKLRLAAPTAAEHPLALQEIAYEEQRDIHGDLR